MRASAIATLALLPSLSAQSPPLTRELAIGLWHAWIDVPFDLEIVAEAKGFRAAGDMHSAMRAHFEAVIEELLADKDLSSRGRYAHAPPRPRG
jgi:hypothetical protein